MPNDLVERLEQPEYTGENRCTPCTLVNLLLAAGVAALVGRRSRALGLLTFAASAALIYLRGYLVPGTPELTKRYLPRSVLALFDTAEPPEPLDESVTRHAVDRVETTTDDVNDPDDATVEETVVENEPETDVDTDAPSDELPPAARHPERDAVEEELVGVPMDETLEAFGVVEADSDDLRLTDAFREAWMDAIDILDDEDERLLTLADLFREPTETVEIEVRDDGRYYGLVDGRARHNWITEAALLSDLAAHRTVASTDVRWSALTADERCSILKGFRVFLETCPECDGPIEPTDEAVESCCQTWEVIAVECGDCGARVLELPAPDGRDPNEGGAANAGVPGGFTR